MLVQDNFLSPYLQAVLSLTFPIATVPVGFVVSVSKWSINWHTRYTDILAALRCCCRTEGFCISGDSSSSTNMLQWAGTAECRKPNVLGSVIWQYWMCKYQTYARRGVVKWGVMGKWWKKWQMFSDIFYPYKVVNITEESTIKSGIRENLSKSDCSVYGYQVHNSPTHDKKSFT